MRFSLPTSYSVASGQYFLPCLLLGGIFVNAITIPANHDQLHRRDLEWTSAPGVTGATPRLEKKSGPILPRRGLTLKPPTKPHGSVDPAEPPPRVQPDDPADPAAAPDVRLNPSEQPPPPPAQAKDQPSNPGPNPDLAGPVPNEAEITALCSVPEGKSIFFSGTWEKVEPYRKQTGLYTDTQAYPPGYTAIWKDVDPVKRREFADRFSRVFAKEAKGEVHVMVNWESGPNPAQVFHGQEWPILKEGLATGRITKIIQVNPNNYAETRIYDPTIYGLTKRAAEIDLNNVPWDVNLDALAEALKRSIAEY